MGVRAMGRRLHRLHCACAGDLRRAERGLRIRRRGWVSPRSWPFVGRADSSGGCYSIVQAYDDPVQFVFL